jgi:hypothetical protein
MDKKTSDKFIEKEFWIVKDTKNNRYYKDSISNTKENAQKYLEYILSQEKETSTSLVKVNLTEINELQNFIENIEDENPSEIVGGTDDEYV